MDIRTGELLSEEEYEHRKAIGDAIEYLVKLPPDIFDKMITSLQQKKYTANDRKNALNKLNKRRAKNKIAKGSRKKNRRRK